MGEPMGAIRSMPEWPPVNPRETSRSAVGGISMDPQRDAAFAGPAIQAKAIRSKRIGAAYHTQG